MTLFHEYYEENKNIFPECFIINKNDKFDSFFGLFDTEIIKSSETDSVYKMKLKSDDDIPSTEKFIKRRKVDNIDTKNSNSSSGTDLSELSTFNASYSDNLIFNENNMQFADLENFLNLNFLAQ